MRVVYDPASVSYADLVRAFFEVHDPTQGMRQGNDVGTQYRSAIYYTTPEQEATAREITKLYGEELARRGFDEITTEIAPLESTTYYYAEDYHQQYLAKNPQRLPLPRQDRCPGPALTVSYSPVAVRGVGERGPLGPPQEKERA